MKNLMTDENKKQIIANLGEIAGFTDTYEINENETSLTCPCYYDEDFAYVFEMTNSGSVQVTAMLNGELDTGNAYFTQLIMKMDDMIPTLTRYWEM